MIRVLLDSAHPTKTVFFVPVQVTRQEEDVFNSTTQAVRLKVFGEKKNPVRNP